MKISDLLELAVRNIRESRLRNVLTAMGIAVGVASLVSMLSLGIGLERLASNAVQRSGVFDTLTVTPASAPTRGLGGPGRSAEASPAEARVLDDSAIQELERLPEAREVYPNLVFAAQWKLADGDPRNATANGVPQSAKESDTFASIQGNFFSSQQAAEVMLPKGFAAELEGIDSRSADAAALAKQLVGKSLTLTFPQRTASADGGFTVAPHSQALKIVGIVDNDSSGARGPGANAGSQRLFIPLAYAESLNVMQNSDLRDGGLRLSQANPVYASVIVRLKSPTQAASAESAIKKMGFNTFSAIDATSSLREVFAVIDLFLGAFGSLALAVASIGIVNTLVMAILERRREIGIMKAIGASDTHIRLIFLVEAAVLGLAGGALGVAIGWSIGKIINFGANIFLARQGVSSQQIWFVPWWLVGGALAFSVIASLLSGAYPAARAARLDPVEALRYE